MSNATSKTLLSYLNSARNHPPVMNGKVPSTARLKPCRNVTLLLLHMYPNLMNDIIVSYNPLGSLCANKKDTFAGLLCIVTKCIVYEGSHACICERPVLEFLCYRYLSPLVNDIPYPNQRDRSSSTHLHYFYCNWTLQCEPTAIGGMSKKLHGTLARVLTFDF